MENASKALLIAGAILIVILLIGVGMMVFQGAQTSIEGSLDTMSSQEVQAFNSQFSSYEGTVKGSAAKSLIQKVIASNGSNTYGRTVTAEINGTKCGDDADTMSTAAAGLTTTKNYLVTFTYGKTKGEGEDATTTDKGIITGVKIEAPKK